MLTEMVKYSFSSDLLAAGTFGVVRFAGEEGLSRCYRFEVLVVAEDAELDLRALLANPVKFTIHREVGGDVVFHGLPVSFEQLQQVEKTVFYRMVMAPKLWRLSLTKHNQIFLGKTVPEIIEACLKDGGLTALDYELRLQKDYAPWEYVCQYGESHLDFISRWLEREGLYYYFEDGDAGEKVIITDNRIAHSAMPQGRDMTYSPPSGLEAGHRDEVVAAFFCRQQLLPQTVILKDYNYRRPSLELTAKAEVHPEGQGEVYIYGEHFRTPEEGNDLAKIRAEEIHCWERRFDGESSVPYLRPGYTFNLKDHYRESFNQGYLTVLLTHAGNQAGYMLSGLGAELADGERETYYRNTFTALPAEVQFRPERKTPKAKFYGFLNARIDAASSGQYAELDDQGRYKILLPFDNSGRKDGKASAWMRMMQPYAGSDHGMHFPLHKGTEVILTFIDGDPDRPVIAGAVPNPETPSLVNAGNQTKARLVSSSGNEIHMEDEAGSERILMHTPKKNSFIRIGAPNDPTTDELQAEIDDLKATKQDKATSPDFQWKDPQAGGAASKDGITLSTGSFFDVTAQMSNKLVLGESTAITIGNDNKVVGGIRTGVTAGLKSIFAFGPENKINTFEFHLAATNLKNAAAETKITDVNRDEVIGNLNGVFGAKIDTAAADEKMAATRSKIIADCKKAIVTKKALLATKNEVALAKNRAVGQATPIAGQRARAVVSAVYTTATKTETAASETRTIISRKNMAASEIKNSLEHTHMQLTETGSYGGYVVV